MYEHKGAFVRSSNNHKTTWNEKLNKRHTPFSHVEKLLRDNYRNEIDQNHDKQVLKVMSLLSFKNSYYHFKVIVSTGWKEPCYL